MISIRNGINTLKKTILIQDHPFMNLPANIFLTISIVSVVIGLSVKNKLTFIDGSMEKPGAADPDLVNSWIQNNNMVISWILNSISKDILSSVIYASTAYDSISMRGFNNVINLEFFN